MDHGMDVDLEPVRSWAKKAVKEGWFAEVCLTAVTLGMFGWTVYALHKALLNAQVMGSTLF
jgi:hypothetical protein